MTSPAPHSIPVPIPMNALSARRLFLTAGLLALTVAPAVAGGFTEPPVVFYGRLTQSADGYTIPVTDGFVTFSIVPATGTPLNLSARLKPDPVEGSFYRLNLPVEKLPSGHTLSPGAISTASLTYGRSNVTYNGLPVTIQPPATGTFNFAEPQRGKRERVDLAVAGPFLDSDGDGLPDWFEDLHGLDKFDSSDAAGLDQFGVRTFLQDYQRLIDPRIGTEYDQWTVAKSIPSPIRQPLVDADGDGLTNLLEFALDTNPTTGDNALASARQLVQVEQIGPDRYLTLTVQKPGRQTVAYAVESSGTLQAWSSAEGSAVVTITDTATLLRVRDATPLPAGGGVPKRFLRLRVSLTQ